MVAGLYAIAEIREKPVSVMSPWVCAAGGIHDHGLLNLREAEGRLNRDQDDRSPIMRSRRLVMFMACIMASLTARTACPAPVTFSGTITYEGTHTGDSLYVVVIDSTGSTTFGFVALAAEFPVPYSVDFDNSAATDAVLLVAALDTDNSGVDPDSLDTIGNHDVVGWFDGHIDPVPVDTDSSWTGLDFGLPTGEIHGNVTFWPGQSWAAVQPFSIPNSWSPVTFYMESAGSYELFGLYAGDWKVRAECALGEICYDGVACENPPPPIPLEPGEVLTGIDFDLSPLAVDASSWSVEAASWGRIKGVYR